MRVVNFEHIYSSSGLYNLFYGGTPYAKLFESCVFLKSVEEWCHFRKVKVPEEGFSFLEIMSGIDSKHEPYIKQHANFPIARYLKNELRQYDDMGPDVIVGDADSITLDEPVDMVAAFYLPTFQILDENWEHSREKLVRVFKNVAKNLRPGGGFYIDLPINCYQHSFDDMIDYFGEDGREQHILPFNHPLRKELGLEANTYIEVNIEISHSYDRIGCCTRTTFEEIELVEEGKRIIDIRVERDWTQRYWSEPETIDIGKDAGFKDFLFFHSDYDLDGHEVTVMDNLAVAESKNKTDLMPTHVIMRT